MSWKTALRRALEATGLIGPDYRWREARLAADFPTQASAVLRPRDASPAG